jgi:hypothetical protein
MLQQENRFGRRVMKMDDEITNILDDLDASLFKLRIARPVSVLNMTENTSISNSKGCALFVTKKHSGLDMNMVMSRPVKSWKGVGVSKRTDLNERLLL